ncbi:E3 ubiquitin-protein ligase RNF128 isoform X1 [Falco biarmicus]|uniref:E3 ubiquitin-protein ligase RNF128 isoform X1 n=1 Tax=Falco rusticolus TaxID=120794 RepID=UPI0018865D06|nr:E3 ubiquitin-protein ligase RNF128 isoform X1 [Falco rusticolus]XP_056215497.1 E3 ubiquitin-protein ligase RNF128 isoform X1 [Falco biarmicus]
MPSGAALLAVAALLCASPRPGPRGAAAAAWSAWLNVSWEDGADRNRSGWEASESGLYGQDSPLQAAAGVLVLPDDRDSFNACSARTNFSGAPAAGGDAPGWLALIQRGGGCSFADKIRLAAERGAAGAVIYNYRGTGNEVLPMSHHGAKSIVAIMIGNLKGMEILHLIESGMKVTMVIQVGKKHGPWMNQYAIFFISVSFFIVTAAAAIGYFILRSARRFRIARAQSRTQRQLKARAKMAISRLQLRTVKEGDEETGPDGGNCAVCLDPYKPKEVVRVLICNHLFHKDCIDPWLLEHRTCPMCICDILKVLDIEVVVEEEGIEPVQATVFNRTTNVPEVNAEGNHSGTVVQDVNTTVPEERAPSENDDICLVNNESQAPAVNVLPHADNLSFEADETHVPRVLST